MLRLAVPVNAAASKVAALSLAVLCSARLMLGPLAAAAPATGLRIESPMVRETLPGQTAGSAYLVIHNESDVVRRLLGAATPVAREIQIHDMSLRDGIMRMRQVTEGVAIPAHGKLAFVAGGLHLMLVGLHAPLSVGGDVPLTLRFDRGGELTIPMRIVSIDDTTSQPKK